MEPDRAQVANSLHLSIQDLADVKRISFSANNTPRGTTERRRSSIDYWFGPTKKRASVEDVRGRPPLEDDAPPGGVSRWVAACIPQRYCGCLSQF